MRIQDLQNRDKFSKKFSEIRNMFKQKVLQEIYF